MQGQNLEVGESQVKEESKEEVKKISSHDNVIPSISAQEVGYSKKQIKVTKSHNAFDLLVDDSPSKRKTRLAKRSKPSGKRQSAEPADRSLKASWAQCFLPLKKSHQRQKLMELYEQNLALFKQMQSEDPVKMVSNRKLAQFGNYDRYYEDRYQFAWKDERLKLFDLKYFKNKEVLDIGCHCGVFTLQLFRRFQPKLCVGVDIDPTLIARAIKSLRSFKQKVCSRKVILNHLKEPQELKSSLSQREFLKQDQLIQRLRDLPLSYQDRITSCEGEEVDDSTLAEMKFDDVTKLFDKMIFRQENWVAYPNTMEKFDTILCLSISKWIHLNYGDIGIQFLFYKAFESLKDGGHFILQPQDFSKYKKKKKLTPQIAKTYPTIKLLPEQFQAFLTQEVGFHLIETLEPPKGSVSTTFERPLLIFKKGGK